MPTSVEQIPFKHDVSPLQVESLHASGELVACDFYISQIEKGEEVTGGWQLGRILNVDHHAPVRRMEKRITSTNLAIERVSAYGIAARSAAILINHTDCDSILSSSILAGVINPDPLFGEAAIAADHTGAENPIADLLQGLDADEDYTLSLRNLRLLLDGRDLERPAQLCLDERRRKRDRAAQVVEQFEWVGQVAYLLLGAPIDGEFFPPLLPSASIIVTASRNPQVPGKYLMKVRLGEAAPSGLVLPARLAFDEAYGGRWNAGSNKRGNGTVLTVDDYAQCLAGIWS